MRKGDHLHIAIGQEGIGKGGGSGAGGTFVVTKKSDGTFAPLVVAGGAGGKLNGTPECNAQTEEFGNGPSGDNNMDIGSSGKSGDIDYYNGGAGYKSNPPGALGQAKTIHPLCFDSGLIGGEYTEYSASDWLHMNPEVLFFIRNK